MNSFVQNLQEKFNKDAKFSSTDFDQKVALVVYTAIASLPTSSNEEKSRKFSFLDNINRIICNYDEVIPVLEDNLEQKFRKRSFSFCEQEK